MKLRFAQFWSRNKDDIIAVCSVCNQDLQWNGPNASKKNIGTHFLNNAKSSGKVKLSREHRAACKKIFPDQWAKKFEENGIPLTMDEKGGSDALANSSAESVERGVPKTSMKRYFPQDPSASSNAATRGVVLKQADDRYAELHLALLMCMSNIPFSILRTDKLLGQNFSAFMNVVNSAYRVPTPRRVQKAILEIYMATRKVIQNVLDVSRQRFCIETDAWSTHGSQVSICNASVSFLVGQKQRAEYKKRFGTAFPSLQTTNLKPGEDGGGGALEMVEVELGLQQCPGSHTGTDLFGFICQGLLQYNICMPPSKESEPVWQHLKSILSAEDLGKLESAVPERDAGNGAIVSCTTDAATNNVAGFRELGAGKHTLCASHMLQTSIQKGYMKLDEAYVVNESKRAKKKAESDQKVRGPAMTHELPFHFNSALTAN